MSAERFITEVGNLAKCPIGRFIYPYNTTDARYMEWSTWQWDESKGVHIKRSVVDDLSQLYGAIMIFGLLFSVPGI